MRLRRNGDSKQPHGKAGFRRCDGENPGHASSDCTVSERGRMAPLSPQEPSGLDDGPSRPGAGLRRTVLVLISGLLLVSIPAFLLIVWGMMHPTFGPGTVKPVTLTLTITLSMRRDDWSRLVQASDKFAIQHDLIDAQPVSNSPVSELRLSRVRYESSDAELTVAKTETNASTIEIRITIREFSGSGAGQRLKAAFETDVVRAGKFGE